VKRSASSAASITGSVRPRSFTVSISALIVIGAGTVIIPGARCGNHLLLPGAQRRAAPIVLVLMLLLINNKPADGALDHSPIFSVIAWATVIIVGALTLVRRADRLPGARQLTTYSGVGARSRR